MDNKGFVLSDEIENEKKLFGGAVYKLSYKLPSIIINKENRNIFKNYTSLIIDISSTCGEEITLLFAELYNIYDISVEKMSSDDEDEQILFNKSVVKLCTTAIAHLSLALNQSKELLSDIKNSESIDKDLHVDGINYCFILILLNTLFHYYTSIFSLLIQKRYAQSENLKSMSQRIFFILSEEFESIRKLFKVVECYKELENKPTLH